MTDDAEMIEEIYEDQRLQNLLDEHWVLRLEAPNVECPKTGSTLAPSWGEPICPNCSNKSETFLMGEGDHGLFCPGCFEFAHREGPTRETFGRNEPG